MNSFARFFRRLFSYLGMAANTEFDKRADPRVQIDQVIEEARLNHEKLSQQAAIVIGNAHHLEAQITKKINEVDGFESNARQAVLMADQARRAGDTSRALELTNAATAFASQLSAAESSLEELRALYDEAQKAATAAKEAVATNAVALQTKLAEKTELLNKLEQAKMQEKINEARRTIADGINATGATPSFDQIREKIELRAAHAKGTADLQADSVESKMMEVQRATLAVTANARLDEIRKNLGLAVPEADVQDSVSSPLKTASNPLAN